MRFLGLFCCLLVFYGACAAPGSFGGGSSGGGGASGGWDVEPTCNGVKIGTKEVVGCDKYAGTAPFNRGHAAKCQRECMRDKDVAVWMWPVSACDADYGLKGGKCVKKQSLPEVNKNKMTAYGTVLVLDDVGEEYEPAIGATVRLLSSGIGMVADADGRFRFDITSDKEQINVRYVGYKEEVVPVKNCLNGCEIKLKVDEQILSEVIVVACGPDVIKNLDEWGRSCQFDDDVMVSVGRLRQYCESPKDSSLNFDEEYKKLQARVSVKCGPDVMSVSLATQAMPPRVETLKVSAQKIRTIAAHISSMSASLGVSAWKTKEGNFNSARLVSDSVAGIVLGTAGGLITANVIKKNQVGAGFEDIHCAVGGQIVADYGDKFLVGAAVK